MKLILKNRGTGKTYDLIQMSAETGAPIVTFNTQYVKDLAEHMEVSIPNPISIRDLCEVILPEQVLVDEMDVILSYMLGSKIVCATLTPESLDLSWRIEND